MDKKVDNKKVADEMRAQAASLDTQSELDEDACEGLLRERTLADSGIEEAKTQHAALVADIEKKIVQFKASAEAKKLSAIELRRRAEEIEGQKEHDDRNKH